MKLFKCAMTAAGLAFSASVLLMAAPASPLRSGGARGGRLLDSFGDFSSPHPAGEGRVRGLSWTVTRRIKPSIGGNPPEKAFPHPLPS